MRESERENDLRHPDVRTQATTMLAYFKMDEGAAPSRPQAAEVDVRPEPLGVRPPLALPVS